MVSLAPVVLQVVTNGRTISSTSTDTVCWWLPPPNREAPETVTLTACEVRSDSVVSISRTSFSDISKRPESPPVPSW